MACSRQKIVFGDIFCCIFICNPVTSPQTKWATIGEFGFNAQPRADQKIADWQKRPVFFLRGIENGDRDGVFAADF